MKIPWLVIALLSVFALSAAGADVGGKWVAQVPGFDGSPMELTFTFKVDGAKLTGTLGSPMGDQPISEGKASGDDISFVMVFAPPDGGGGPGGGMKIVFKGKVAGDQIKMTQTFEGGPGGEGGGMPPTEYLAKRAK
jgi:hypothetical protein